jgi:gamma-glutamylcyclotransferase (GGCT)/AIG2-like uncharacterized protein YtfP
VRNLFVYGTLMCEDIMHQVAGCLPARLAGALTGYERRAVKGEHYPGLVPGAGGRVDGVVYRDVPGCAWARLDRFEGDMYRRRCVRVQLTDGATLMAETYVVRRGFVSRLDNAEWNFSEFLRSGKAKFCRHYQGYAQLD